MTNEMKHTPGPWHKLGSSIWANDHCQVAIAVKHVCLPEVESARSNEEVDANATLIAAAPALKKACERIAELADFTPFDRPADPWHVLDMVAEFATAALDPPMP